ncbi:MAG: hypothetical protein ACRDMZ_03945 [Solirubrobacteraceae bacterium]
MRTRDAIRRKPSDVAAVLVVLALGLAGCGDDDFTNAERAPAPITLSASITPTNVTLSPARFGAGPIELIASNLTKTSQRLTLRSERLAGGSTALEQRTGPINPGDTASLTADLTPGTYRVTAGAAAITPATVRVGPRRASASDQLLQP